MVESRVQEQDGHGALLHHLEAQYTTTIMTNHPGTSCTFPNALTVIWISHVDVSMYCRSRVNVKEAKEASLASDRDRQGRFPHLLGTLEPACEPARPMESCQTSPPSSLDGGARRLAKQAFLAAEYFSRGEKSPVRERGFKTIISRLEKCGIRKV